MVGGASHDLDEGAGAAGVVSAPGPGRFVLHEEATGAVEAREGPGALDLRLGPGHGEHPAVGGRDHGRAPEEPRDRVAELDEAAAGQHDAHEHAVHLVLALEQGGLALDDLDQCLGPQRGVLRQLVQVHHVVVRPL